MWESFIKEEGISLVSKGNFLQFTKIVRNIIIFSDIKNT